MKFNALMLVVEDMPTSRKFYEEVFGAKVVADFGANITFDHGFSLQTKDSWAEFIGKPADAIIFGCNDKELYYEEEDFDDFLARLDATPDIRYFQPVSEAPWGQRAVRILDPDDHIIEIGEPVPRVCQRFVDSGMTMDEVAQRMDIPLDYVKECLS